MDDEHGLLTTKDADFACFDGFCMLSLDRGLDACVSGVVLIIF